VRRGLYRSLLACVRKIRSSALCLSWVNRYLLRAAGFVMGVAIGSLSMFSIMSLLFPPPPPQ
jgi:hypothetical protein